MKQHFRTCVLAAAMALAVSGVAQAHDDDDEDACSNATLHGLYAFTASGFNIVAGVLQPKAIVELIRFNGDKAGTLTVPAATVSINGVISRSTPNGLGATGSEQTVRAGFSLVRQGPPMTCLSNSKVPRFK